MAWPASRRVARPATARPLLQRHLTLVQKVRQLGGTPEWLLPEPTVLEMILPGDPRPISASRSPANIAQILQSRFYVELLSAPVE
jgi:hypothetical protein